MKKSNCLVLFAACALALAFCLGLSLAPSRTAALPDDMPQLTAADHATLAHYAALNAHAPSVAVQARAQFAQAAVDAPVALAPQPASAVAWYANPTLWATAIAFVTGILGIWSHKEKTRAQKINESLIMGIESATRIPEVAAQEKAIKERIKQYAENAGVQPLLARLVQDLT